MQLYHATSILSDRNHTVHASVFNTHPLLCCTTLQLLHSEPVTVVSCVLSTLTPALFPNQPECHLLLQPPCFVSPRGALSLNLTWLWSVRGRETNL